jgi:hypothetical protein
MEAVAATMATITDAIIASNNVKPRADRMQTRPIEEGRRMDTCHPPSSGFVTGLGWMG